MGCSSKRINKCIHESSSLLDLHNSLCSTIPLGLSESSDSSVMYIILRCFQYLSISFFVTTLVHLLNFCRSRRNNGVRKFIRYDSLFHVEICTFVSLLAPQHRLPSQTAFLQIASSGFRNTSEQQLVQKCNMLQLSNKKVFTFNNLFLILAPWLLEYLGHNLQQSLLIIW